MKVETVSMNRISNDDNCIYTNIIIAAIRSRQIIDKRYEKVKLESNIEDTEQFETLIEDEDFNAPKTITIAVQELLNNELEWKLLEKRDDSIE